MPIGPASSLVRVRLTPRGGSNVLMRWDGETLHARVAAPPVDGAANRALAELLAGRLRVPRSSIAIVSGEASRTKVIRIDGVSQPELSARIADALA